MMRSSTPFGSLPPLPSLGPGPNILSAGGFDQLNSFSNISAQAAQIANTIHGLMQILSQVSQHPNFPTVISQLMNMLFQSGSDLV
jgi:hypothetical protein